MDQKSDRDRATKSRLVPTIALLIALAVFLALFLPTVLRVAFKRPTPVPAPATPVLVLETIAWLDGGSLETHLRDSEGIEYYIILQITNFRESRRSKVPRNFDLLWRPSKDTDWENATHDNERSSRLLRVITLAAENQRDHPQKDDARYKRDKGVIDSMLFMIQHMIPE